MSEFAFTDEERSFFAPERMKKDPTINAPTDIWALGALLYSLCNCGEPPFGYMPTLKSVKTNILPPLSLIYSEKLSQPITWMLEKNPLNRPTADQIYEKFNG